MHCQYCSPIALQWSLLQSIERRWKTQCSAVETGSISWCEHLDSAATRAPDKMQPCQIAAYTLSQPISAPNERSVTHWRRLFQCNLATSATAHLFTAWYIVLQLYCKLHQSVKICILQCTLLHYAKKSLGIWALILYTHMRENSVGVALLVPVWITITTSLHCWSNFPNIDQQPQ